MIKRSQIAFALNVIGLSVAFTVLTVLVSQVKYEMEYNSGYKDVENLYRLSYLNEVSGKHKATSCMPLVKELISELPEVDEYCMFGWAPWRMDFTLADGEKQFNELFYGVTPGFLSVFQPEVVVGDPKNCLDDWKSAIMPQSVAERIFGKENPIGKVLDVEGETFTVTLVYRDFPENSTIKNAVYSKIDDLSYTEWSYIPYVRLLPGSDPGIVSRKMKESISGNQDFNGQYRFYLEPVSDIYFHSKVSIDEDRGNVNTTLAFFIIGILIMGIAYVNFINFSTALAPVRIKTINTKKVMGALTSRVRVGIIAEAVCVSVLAFILSLAWTTLFIQSPLSGFFIADLSFGANISTILSLGGLSVMMGVLAGVYPAFYMTSFQPALVLKGTFALTPKGVKLRNTLLSTQFVFTIVLITVAGFIKLQHSFMQDMNTGFDRENIVYIPLSNEIRQQGQAFAHELEGNPEVLGHTKSRFLPGHVEMGWGRYFDGQDVSFKSWPVSHNFLRFFNIKMAEGNDFFNHDEKGVNKIILNRKMVDKFKLENVIGKEIGCFNNNGVIVGIAENINFNSLLEEIEPMAFVCGDDQWDSYMLIKISGRQVPSTVAHIRDTYKKFSTEECNVRFLDDEMARLYMKEENFAKLITLFGFLTVVISLMGIYGLILFNARYKTKEIGVRKVNGATSGSILVLLNKGFLKLIGISYIIAVPSSYFLVKEWLERFPYQTPVYWWVFVASGLLTLLIMLATVSYQSWKASTTNPVDSLKSE